MKILSNIRLLLIGLWLGAAIFFSFATAPSVFAVLNGLQIPNYKSVAGEIVSRNLMIINLSGLVIGALLLATSFVGGALANRFALWTERILLILLTIACAVGQFVIALWLRFVKAEIGRPIDEVAAGDPLRIKFENLHESSVWVMFVAMVAALIVFFIISGKTAAAAPAPKTAAQDFDFDKDFKI